MHNGEKEYQWGVSNFRGILYGLGFSAGIWALLYWGASAFFNALS